MKIEKILFGISIVAMLVSCGDSPKKEVVVPPEYTGTFQKASIACPGFNPSASEITIGAPTVGGIYYDGEFHYALKGFSIEITGLLSYAPTAHGNHCEYYLTQNEDRVVTIKDACASLCKGEAINTEGNNFEAKLAK